MPDLPNTLSALEAYLADPGSEEAMRELCRSAPPIFLAPRLELGGRRPLVHFDMMSTAGTTEHIVISVPGLAHLALSDLAGCTTALNSRGKDRQGNERQHLKECAERGEGGRGVPVARTIARAFDTVPPEGAEAVSSEGDITVRTPDLREYQRDVSFKDGNSLNLDPANLALVPGRGERGDMAVLVLMHRHLGTERCRLPGIDPAEQAAVLKRLFDSVAALLDEDQQP